MLDILFGEGQLAVKLVVGLIVVIGLLAAFFYGLRRFGGERLGAGGGRGRQPRLAVIDAAMVDGRRRLVLIRRDNVEHLLIIGGPTDVVVEQNIVRAAGALPREAAPVALPRTAALGEGSMWPLQPEPAPRELASREPAPREAAPREPAPRPDPPMRLDPPARPEPTIRLEPTMRSEPAPRIEPRPQRQSPPPLPAVEESMQWSAESEPPPPPPPSRERRSRTVDPLAGLAGLAEELARVPAAPEPSSSSNSEEPPRQPLRRVVRAQPAPSAPPPTPQPAAQAPAADAEFNSSADQNLAEMAQRLEAALRRPAKTDELRPAQGTSQDAPRAVPRAAPEPEPAESGEYEPAPPPARPAAESMRAPRSEAKPARADAKPAPQKSLYDSLEQEMASLLGRPNTKP